MKAPIKKLFFASLLATAVSSPAMGNESSVDVDTASRINSVNELVRAGQFDEALDGYRQVRPTDETRDELNYNLAVAQYRSGDIPSAKRLFTEVAASPKASLAAASRYNLGNCYYANAVQLAERDRTAAIEALQQAIGHYRGSLQGNPHHTDARANIELAGQLLKKLKEEQQQEEQQQQQQEQQQQQQQDSQEQDSGSQQNESQQNESQQSESQQTDSQQSDSQQSESQQTDSQQSESQQTDSQQSDSQQDQTDPSDTQPPSEQQQDAQDQDAESKENESQQGKQEQGQDTESNPDQQASDSQSSDEKPSNPGEAPEQMREQEQSKPEQQPAERTANSSSSPMKDRQPQPAGEPATEEEPNALDQPLPTGTLTAAGEQDADTKPSGTVSMADPNAEDGLMTKEEALKMLQSVRDRDMLRRLRQEQIDRSRHIPVDRDW